MAGVELTGFLSQTEKQKIQSLYEYWINHLNPTTFIPKLFASNMVSVFDQQNIEAEPVKMKKSSVIFHDVLMRSTYEDMSKIRNLLVQTGDLPHIELAKKLPSRGEPINFKPPPRPQPPQSPPINRERYSEQCTDTTHKSYDHFSLGVSPAAQPMDTDPPYNPGRDRRALKSTFKSSKIEPSKIIESHYGFKSTPHGKVTTGKGKGLCVVIRNFSTDLPGYASDAKGLRNFFGEVLKYDVWEGHEQNLVDLNYDGFEYALRRIVNQLKTDRYDRFFFFILSHGDEKGIKLSKAGNGREEEPGKRYKVEDIVAKFTHDRMAEMKDYPKCFFIQACRGEEVAKAAADPSATLQTRQDPYEPTPLPAMTIGRDILVCYPTEAGYYSWVPGTGSWFIRETISVLWNYYQNEHLLDMLVEAARHVSEIQKQGQISSAEGLCIQESVCQMPHYVCTLTKKFYLQYPPLSQS